MPEQMHGGQPQMFDKRNAIVSHVMNACLNVLGFSSANAPVVEQNKKVVSGQILYYWQPTLGVAGKTGYHHQGFAFSMALIIKDLCTVNYP